MTYTIETRGGESISLQEYIDYVSCCVDLQNVDSVLESAGHLRAVADDRTFVTDYINKELEHSWDDFQPENSYSAQTLTLGSGTDFSIRVNMWLPPSADDDGWDQRLYAYGLPHDHNFSFLTVGYAGPGYWTEIYEYDGESVEGYPGESVDLTYLERTSLPTGKTMFYRASKDIHIQEPPEAFSMSVNLLIVSPSVKRANQYTFDLDAQRIRGYVPNAGAGRVMLAQLGKYVGNERTSCLLDSLSVQHPQPRLRWAAHDALAVLNDDRSSDIYDRAESDPHPFVRRMARERRA